MNIFNTIDTNLFMFTSAPFIESLHSLRGNQQQILNRQGQQEDRGIETGNPEIIY